MRYLIALGILVPQIAWAQDAADTRVRDMMAKAKDAYAVPARLTRCQRDAAPDEIVVCARDESEKFRVPTDSDNGATDTGVPHSDVGTRSSLGGASVRGCFLQKCPKEVYLIDLSTIPMAPPGSDADKIAKGEMRAP